MSHNPHHDHHHTPELKSINNAFIIGIALNFLFVLIEVIIGLATNSLALLSDAGHNLSDVASLAMALIAFKLSQSKPTENYSFGFQKSTILVALINAVILLISIGAIVWEAYQRLVKPEIVQGNMIAIVAAIGIFINAFTAFLFFKSKDADLNAKGAFLHLAADAVVSIAVVIGGVIMFYTHLFWIDSLLSFVIAIVIFISTWKLLKETVRLSLDGTPHNIDVEKIKQVALSINHVKDIYHLHVWAMSTTKNALTAHVMIDDYANAEKIKEELKHEWIHLNVHHCTIEMELTNSTPFPHCTELKSVNYKH